MTDAIDSVDSVTVTADQLRIAVSALNNAPPPEAETLEGCVRVIIEVLLEDGIEDQQQLLEAGSAIFARLMAFADLLRSAPASRWLAPQGSQPVSSLKRPVLEAMAAAPLRVEQGHYRFNSDRFFTIVLERAAPAGCA